MKVKRCPICGVFIREDQIACDDEHMEEYYDQLDKYMDEKEKEKGERWLGEE